MVDRFLPGDKVRSRRSPKANFEVVGTVMIGPNSSVAMIECRRSNGQKAFFRPEDLVGGSPVESRIDPLNDKTLQERN